MILVQWLCASFLVEPHHSFPMTHIGLTQLRIHSLETTYGTTSSKRKNGIAHYVEEADALYQKCPDPLKEHMGSEFVAGQSDEQKLGMVQLSYLSLRLPQTLAARKIISASSISGYTLAANALSFDVYLRIGWYTSLAVPYTGGEVLKYWSNWISG